MSQHGDAISAYRMDDYKYSAHAPLYSTSRATVNHEHAVHMLSDRLQSACATTFQSVRPNQFATHTASYKGLPCHLLQHDRSTTQYEVQLGTNAVSIPNFTATSQMESVENQARLRAGAADGTAQTKKHYAIHAGHGVEFLKPTH